MKPPLLICEWERLDLRVGVLSGWTAFHAEAEYCGCIDNGTNPEVAMCPDKRGGLDNDICEMEGWKTGGGRSREDARTLADLAEADLGGPAYADGIGGGVYREVNMPIPTRIGEGAWMVVGGGLEFKSMVSTSVLERLSGVLLRVELDLRRAYCPFSDE